MLEEIDGLLVQQLQRDGRASFQALGRAVGLTRTAARARVSRLLAAGVIKVVALPDAAVAGQAVVAHLSADVTGSALAAAHGIAKLRSAVFVSVASGQFPVIADLRSPGEAAPYSSSLRSKLRVRCRSSSSARHSAQPSVCRSISAAATASSSPSK